MNAPVMFQALPPLSPEEYVELERSILANGVMVPILLDENGVVIDGHHRQQIAQHHELPCPFETKRGLTDAEKRGLALSLNLHRRHLTREQKRALVAESIKADPQLSDREHGRRTGVDHKTATKVREELTTGGEIPHLEYRENPQGRLQPAHKPAPKPPATDLISSDDLAALNSPSEQPTTDHPVITKDEEPVPSAPRRRPITDVANDVLFDLTKAADRVRRLIEDDRFNRNADQISLRHKSDLIRVRQTLDAAIAAL